ncbi:hypothetical protein ABG79_02171 [Caloramator mitchellensis]|uniref:Phage transcriptional regulator, RinA family n=1 Tax=Caloramator mitchellensis TaxID=908809 RepID=A0A0R3JRD4_CALMK|nr:hypothetical protein [Caloramator mitchellensis]KRQ86039.1 hypothetical protein ABG79_02171 [Caloramator mitchellensis]
MIKDDVFRKTEGHLYRYYNTLKKIKALEEECKELEKQKEKIKQDLKETKVSIDTELNMGIDYSRSKIQTSNDGTSYAEKALVKEIEKLEKEWFYVRKKYLKKRIKIRELERQIYTLKCNLLMLSEENKRFLELKYGDKKSIDEIAYILNIARATVYRKREELIEDIARWVNLIG